MIEKIKQFYNDNRKNPAKEKFFYAEENIELYTYLDNFILVNYGITRFNFSEKLYLCMNNIVKYPVCGCGENKKFRYIESGYTTYCGNRKCPHRVKSITQKVKKTNLERYGVECTQQSKETKEKTLATFKERYGGHPLQSSIIRDKIKETNLERYGVEWTTMHSETRSKMENTCLDRFGVSNPFGAKEIRSKIKETNMQKYGVEFPMQSEQIQSTTRKNNLEKYGVTNPAKLDSVKQKMKQAVIERYGVGNFSQADMSKESLEILEDKEKLLEIYHNNKSTMITADKLGVSRDTIVDRLHYHNIDIIFNNVSAFEKEIQMWLTEHNIEFRSNIREFIKTEIDIYIPSHNLGIECNGSYWHAENQGKDSQYHLKKTEACIEHDIHLIHIWEHDWNDKREIIKSRLGSLLGLNERIYARKCQIQEVSSHESVMFQQATHIQGSVNGSIRYGLYYLGNLVALMTFGKSRFNKNIDYELLRYSSKLGVNVVGGASRLFSHFIKQYSPLSVISYSDKSMNVGRLYTALGFKKSHTSDPSYRYTKNYKDFHDRVQFQKHKLRKLLESFDSTLTEWQNMQNNGYDRIWNCGNDVFIWRK